MKQQLQLYTLDEAAERFRVSRRTFVDFIKLHPFYRILGKRKLFTEGDLLALYEALQCPSNSSAVKAARTGTSEAPPAASWSARLQALTTAKPPRRSARGANGRSFAAPFSVISNPRPLRKLP